MAYHFPDDNIYRPLPLPLLTRRLPVLQLPLPNIPTQASTSIRTHITNALLYAEATRQPVRARKTTPPVLKGYIPPELRPLPPITNGVFPHQPAVQMGSSGIADGGGSKVAAAGFAAVFRVGVGVRNEGGMTQAPQSTPLALGPHSQTPASWLAPNHMADESLYVDQPGLFELVDPTAYHPIPIPQQANIESTVSQHSFLQPRAFPVEGAEESYDAGQVTPSYPSSDPQFVQPYISPSYPVCPHTPTGPSVPQNFPFGDFSSTQPLFPTPTVPTTPQPASGRTTFVPPTITISARRFRIPAPIIIPSQTQPSQTQPTQHSTISSAHPPTAGLDTSLLTPHRAGATSAYMPYPHTYPEATTPLLVTPFDTVFPTFPTYPTYTSPLPLPNDSKLIKDQGNSFDPFSAFLLPTAPLSQSAIPPTQQLSSSFISPLYPTFPWSDAGIPNVGSWSSTESGPCPSAPNLGLMAQGRVTSGGTNGMTQHLSSRATFPHTPACITIPSQHLQSSFLFTPDYASFPPLTGQASCPTGANQHFFPPLPELGTATSIPNPLFTSPSPITPPLVPTQIPAKPTHRKTVSLKPVSPIKYVFPEDYEYADIVQGVEEGVAGKQAPPVRRLSSAVAENTGRRVTGERYACDDCDETFSRISDATRHKTRRHVSPDKWEYACDECHERFSRKDHLVQHKKRTRCPVAREVEPESSKRPVRNRSSNDPLGRPKKAKTAE